MADNMTQVNPPLTAAAKRKIRKRNVARRWAKSAGIPSTPNDYLLTLTNIPTAPEPNAQTPGPMPITNINTSTPVTGVKRQASSSPNSGEPSKVTKPQFPTLKVFRKDQDVFTFDDRAEISKALIEHHTATPTTDASLPQIIDCGRSRMAGSCLVLEAPSHSIGMIKRVINTLPRFFALEEGEDSPAHPLCCSTSPLLMDCIEMVPKLIADHSKGHIKLSDMNLTRTPKMINDLVYFWIQVTTKALQYITSNNSLLFLCGMPFQFKMERSRYVPSRAEIIALNSKKAATKSPLDDEESEEEDTEKDQAQLAYEQEQIEQFASTQAKDMIDSTRNISLEENEESNEFA